ncbi:class I SAM-dependent methyltransferase [Nonomuraea sp. WAC 01424]|uniref:daptide-type RiPP biosynthesis methyltransferase n=1 Tax=Nonomuraea sp. WAC 01424 TaxID=2203200 RepID=UPI000F7819B9|nr:daptide-type RiPP biosynthesis methyltransferase [Nonomuraea sp. WAC 01424]RSM99089.1 class I SAM-dependent methyltransferase [Nonomuraea sp. WAC 01424]
MSDQIARGSAWTARADVLLAAAGERGVLCDIYDEEAADIYHDLMQGGTSQAREFTTRIPAGSGPILELAAGSGRLTFPLLALGRKVTALELSPAMLAILRRRLDDAPARLRDLCTLVQGDMSAFTLDRRFDVVVLDQSITLLDGADRPGLYACVREHLEPGGRLLLTMADSDAAKAKSVERFQEVSGMSGRPYVLHERLSAADEVRELTICPADETADPFVVCTTRIRLLQVDLIARELEQAGFEVIARTPLAFAGARHNDVFLLEAARPS